MYNLLYFVAIFIAKIEDISEKLAIFSAFFLYTMNELLPVGTQSQDEPLFTSIT